MFHRVGNHWNTTCGESDRGILEQMTFILCQRILSFVLGAVGSQWICLEGQQVDLLRGA